MGKSIQCLFNITVFFAIIFIGISAFAKDKETPVNKEKHSPIISKNIKNKAEAGEEVAVFIKLKEEWEPPLVNKTATAIDPAHFISKQDIKKLQKALETSFTPEESKKDIKVIHKLNNIPWISGKINQKALEKLKVHPNVAIITEDIKERSHLAQSGPLIHSDIVNQDPGYGYTGNGVTVAVIDSGIDTNHPDLQNDLIWEECFLTDSGCPGGGTRESGSGSAEDGYGHGTHVSGIITSGNSTYKGNAPDTKIVALKTLDDTGSGWTSDRVAALDWIVSNKDTYGISIVNMSLGTNYGYSGVCDSNRPAGAAVSDAAKDAGIVLFASSGNDAWNGYISDPACLSSVVSVGAVYDADVVHALNWGICQDLSPGEDQIVCFSNVSSDLDLLAPGSRIDSSYLGGGIINYSGTSMASPHAAALAALMIQKNSFLTPDDIENILKSSGTPTYDARIGITFSRVEAVGALNYTPDPITTLTLTTTGSGSGTVTGSGTYNYRNIATVTATSESGSIFAGWSGPDAAECNTGSVSMLADKSCTASFFTLDYCPSDPLKIEPGICGCGVVDTDTDSDGTPDCNDLDDDNDGMTDDYEIDQGFNPLDAFDANNDPDGDGLINLDEYYSGSDPHDIDTDNDGIADGFDGYPLDDQQNLCLDLIQNDLTLEDFTSLQAAINDPNALDNDTVQITAADFAEDILYSRNIILTLSGGYYCNFSNNPSTSFINSLTISDGTVTVENITIRP